MKTTTSTRNTDSIARGRDAYLAEYKANEAKKKAAKAEMPQKARIYKRITSISFTVTCVAAIAAMYLTLAHVLSDQSLITSIFLIGVGTITIAGALVFFTAIIAKKIWKHRLLKMGLMLPPELD